MHIRQLWDPAVVSISEDDDVVGGNGRPLRLRTLIARRWGWPKSASYIAADRIELDAHMSGRPWVLHLDGPQRTIQQEELLERVDGLSAALLEGLAGRSSREVHAGHPITQVVLVLSRPVVDAGLVSRLLGVVGDHVGVTSREEIRERATLSTEGGAVSVVVDVAGIDLDE